MDANDDAVVGEEGDDGDVMTDHIPCRDGMPRRHYCGDVGEEVHRLRSHFLDHERRHDSTAEFPKDATCKIEDSLKDRTPSPLDVHPEWV
jgi:hypothetical protein